MPQHVYELTLMERYRKSAPPANPGYDTTNTIVPNPMESEPCEFVLLRPTKRIQYFVRVQKAHLSSSDISLTLLPESPEETDFLCALGKWNGDDIAFSYRDDALWVTPQTVSKTPAGWDITLKKSEEQGIHNEKPFGDWVGDQIAELRAKRILLNDKLSVATPWLGEYRVHNGLSLQYENGLVVYKSPLPQLYWAFRETPEQFKKFARLVSVLFLKLTHTVEEILQLELELQESAEFPDPSQRGNNWHPRYQKMKKGTALKVRFKGRRFQYFLIRDATVLEFEGMCPLTYQGQGENGDEPPWR